MSFLLLPAVLVSTALAAPVGETPRVEYAQRTEVDFLEPVDVQGQVVKPRITVVGETVRGQFRPLIALRESFTDRMNASVRAVR